MAAPGAHEREEYDTKMRHFHNFLNQNRDHWKAKISSELANERFRIQFDLGEIEKELPGINKAFLKEPVRYLLPWEDALLAFLKDMDPKGVRRLKQPIKVDVVGAYGENHVTPRGITSDKLQNMVCVEGIVVKAGIKTPKLLQSIHVKKNGGEDGQVQSRDHRDATSFVSRPNAGAMPKQDTDGNELEMEIGLSVYKDYQKFTISETPEQAPPGQIPRSVEVICEGDLADQAKVGERIQVSGVYRSFPPVRAPEWTNGIFPSRIIATSIVSVKDLVESPFSPEDIMAIREIGARKDTFELLARSFAPSICGHDNVKKGLLLQQIGGTEKNLPNGTHLRGDVNVLMIGDPSCGKSQMLRFVMNLDSRAISTTGRGSSGVGLTAAVTREAGSSEFQLEAGAMVLADRTFICIDEFDKMGIADRVAIHEAMEQQVVTISKAGMHVQLNARCSVVAAANPIFGNFDPTLDLAKNIGMPDSLLSRFDLVFVVRDLTTVEIDRKIATQVLKQAQSRIGGKRRGVEQVHSTILQRRQETVASETPENTPIFEKLVAGPGEDKPEVVTVDFLKKYLKYCKIICKAPVLTPEAQQEVADRYVEMRMKFQTGHEDPDKPDARRKPKLAVTTRTLEALIRLATAHAKLKLRADEVTKEDVIEGYKLMLAAREEDEGTPEAALADEDYASEEAVVSGNQEPSRGKKRARDSGNITANRLETLQSVAARVFADKGESEMSLGELLERVNANLMAGEPAFEDAEFRAGLDELEARNKLMVIAESDLVVQIM
jgi:DNA replication licensing factor MCM3